jgi:hypothetical protein
MHGNPEGRPKINQMDVVKWGTKDQVTAEGGGTKARDNGINRTYLPLTAQDRAVGVSVTRAAPMYCSVSIPYTRTVQTSCVAIGRQPALR